MTEAQQQSISGAEINPWSIHTTVVACIPGSAQSERVPILRILVSEAGELVFISKPYDNLVRKPGDPA